LSYPANRQTDRQTYKRLVRHILFAKVKIYAHEKKTGPMHMLRGKWSEGN